MQDFRKSSVVVDLANLAFDQSRRPSLDQLQRVVAAVRREVDGQIVFLLDAAFRRRLPEADSARLEAMILNGDVIQTPAGMTADRVIIDEARSKNGFIISNDLYREYQDRWDLLRERLVKAVIWEDEVRFYPREEDDRATPPPPTPPVPEPTSQITDRDHHSPEPEPPKQLPVVPSEKPSDSPGAHSIAPSTGRPSSGTLGAAYHDFFVKLRDQLGRSDQLEGRHFFKFRQGRGFSWSFTFPQEGLAGTHRYFRVELYADKPKDPRRNAAVVDAITRSRSEIERCVHAKLLLDTERGSESNKKTRFVAIYWSGDDRPRPLDLLASGWEEEVREWAIQTFREMERCLRPLIKQFGLSS